MAKIKFIVAIDNRRGLARGSDNMPWHLPGDLKYFQNKTMNQDVLMGFNTYSALGKPLPGRTNHVLNTRSSKLKSGFESVDTEQLEVLLKSDIWVIGGAKLFGDLILRADELYITQIEKDFNCNKFFPDYKEDFKLENKSSLQAEKGISYTFQKWTRV